jgi:hypothetical protein
MKLSESQLRSITNKELKKFFRLNENETNNFGDNPERPTPTEEFFMDVFVFLAKQPNKRAPIQAFSYKDQEEAKADGWNGPIGPYAISGQIRTVLYRELPYSFKIAPYVKDRYEQRYIYFDKVVEGYKDFVTCKTMTLDERLKSKNINENDSYSASDSTPYQEAVKDFADALSEDPNFGEHSELYKDYSKYLGGEAAAALRDANELYVSHGDNIPHDYQMHSPVDENRRHRNRSQMMFPLHALRESKFRSIIAEEIRRLHEADDDTESQVREMEGESRRIAIQELDQSLNEFMDKMSALGIAEEEACEDLANIVKEFCEDKTSSAYEHQMTYGDEEEDDDGELVDEMYREFVDEFKAIIETGEEPEDSDEFKEAVEAMGEEMARNALDDAITETDVGY